MEWFGEEICVAAMGRAVAGMSGMRRYVLFFLLTVLVPGWAGAPPCLEAARLAVKSAGGCRKVVLEGEVESGQEWRRAIGEGWVFRVLPIAGGAIPKSASKGQRYSGWDLAMDRERGGGYPDGLLLATPPYGSLNPREIGTTYGMRAQDAIAWEPRRFRFLTTTEQLARAKALYAEVMEKAAKGLEGGGGAGELLAMASGGPEVGAGEFEVLDARLVAGVADPPAFARRWAEQLGRVPHTLVQGGGAGSTALGELRSIRFRATLVVPGSWKLQQGLSANGAKCSE